MATVIETAFAFEMDLRVVCMLLAVALSSSTASSDLIGSGSLLKVTQERQLYKLFREESEEQKKGSILIGEDYVCRTIDKNRLNNPRRCKFSSESELKSAYFFRGGQAINKKEVRCCMIWIKPS